MDVNRVPPRISRFEDPQIDGDVKMAYGTVNEVVDTLTRLLINIDYSVKQCSKYSKCDLGFTTGFHDPMWGLQTPSQDPNLQFAHLVFVLSLIYDAFLAFTNTQQRQRHTTIVTSQQLS